MITTQDKELLAKKGITEEQIAEQLACFQTGFPFLKLDAAASIEKGILAPDAEEQKAYLAAWDAYTNTDKTVVKFVPASGAASRMFKNLFEFLSADYDQPTTKFEQAFFDGIKNFAFYDDLNVACQRISGKDIPGLMEEGNYKAVVSALLETAGLNYGALPKGLLKFHKYPEGSRTPMEEHLAEGALYAAGKSGKVNVHFTVSTEHRELFKKLVTEKVDDFAKRYGVDYYITFSEQKPSTDTIAADMDNQPFRDNGKLLFRPGGHGALIENLNDLDADIIFIKNIDNVVPDRLKADTVTYKKLIAGVLVTLQTSIRIPHAARQRQVYARPDDGNASIPAKETLLQEPGNERPRRLRTGHLPQKQVQPPDACLRNGEERRRTRRRSVPCLQQRRNYLPANSRKLADRHGRSGEERNVREGYALQSGRPRMRCA